MGPGEAAIIKAAIEAAPGIIGSMVKNGVLVASIASILLDANLNDKQRWDKAVEVARQHQQFSEQQIKDEEKRFLDTMAEAREHLETQEVVTGPAQIDYGTRIPRVNEPHTPNYYYKKEAPTFKGVDFTDIANNKYTKYSEEQRQLMEKKWKQYYDELQNELPLLGNAILNDSQRFTGRPVPETDRYARLADAFNAQMLYDPGEFQVAQGRTSPNIGHGKWVTNPATLNTQDQKQMDKLRDLQGQIGNKRLDIIDEWFRKKRDSKFEELSALLTQMRKEQFWSADSEMQRQLMDYQQWTENMKADFANFLGMNRAQLDGYIARQNAQNQMALQQDFMAYQTELQEKLFQFEKMFEKLNLPLSAAYINRQLALIGQGDIQQYFQYSNLGRTIDIDEVYKKLVNIQNEAKMILDQGNSAEVFKIFEEMQLLGAEALYATGESFIKALDYFKTAEGAHLAETAKAALRGASNGAAAMVDWFNTFIAPHTGKR